MKQQAHFSAWLLIAFMLLIPRSPSARSAESVVPPPDVPHVPNLDDAAATLSFSPVTKAFFGNLVVEFDETTLGEILRSAGTGAIHHRGQEGESEDWVCFTVSSGAQSQRIWIAAGVLGGPEHAVGGIYAAASSVPLKKAPACPELPTQLRPVSLASSVWLGSSQNQLRDRLGEPSVKKDDWWLYFYHGEVQADGFEETAVLRVRIVDGKVVTLYAWKTVTD